MFKIIAIYRPTYSVTVVQIIVELELKVTVWSSYLFLLFWAIIVLSMYILSYVTALLSVCHARVHHAEMA